MRTQGLIATLVAVTLSVGCHTMPPQEQRPTSAESDPDCKVWSSYWRGFDTGYRLAFEGTTGIPDFFDGDRRSTAYVEGYIKGQDAGRKARLALEIERVEKEEHRK